MHAYKDSYWSKINNGKNLVFYPRTCDEPQSGWCVDGIEIDNGKVTWKITLFVTVDGKRGSGELGRLTEDEAKTLADAKNADAVAMVNRCPHCLSSTDLASHVDTLEDGKTDSVCASCGKVFHIIISSTVTFSAEK